MTTLSPGSCNGDNYLRLYDPTTGSELTYNDDSNGSLCSQITYSFSASCRTYELREGCYSSGSCGGQVYYTGSSAISQSPIAIATTMPTGIIGSPTAFPTGTFGAPTQQNIPGSERDAMYDLYTSTNGNNWYSYGSRWDFSDPYSNPCIQGWHGVQCSSWYSDGYYHVYELSLGYRNLIGTIPDSIVNLSYLRGLYLDYNLLYGTIPRSIGQLLSLYDLLLSNNYFTGVIPDSFGQQNSFGEFDVSNNYLEGSIPLSIFNIPYMNYLNVKGNRLTGSLSSNISSVNSLDVSGNNMVGIIPSSLCNSSILQEIYLYGNNFQCYPQCLKSNVRYAYVGNTPLCPPVPSTAPAAPTTLPTRVINVPSLLPTVVPGAPTRKPTVILGAPTTFPTGTFGAPTQQNIPESERDALYDLYTSTNGHNWYSYGSPWDFSDPYSNPCTQYWQGLYCSFWYSDGYYHVYELSLTYRNLVGTIPDSIVNLSYLSNLYMDYNLLHGTIPRSIGQLSSLYDLLLSNNYLIGVIPDSFGQQNYFGEFDVSNNYLEGSIPLSIFNIPYLWSLNVKGNLLTGSLPDLIVNLYISRLDVSGNNMVGIIPSSLCASDYLQEIYLYGNDFQCYPQCLTSNLRYAYVGNTPLCPPVPSTAPAAPTALPTFPSNGYYCPAFSTSNTNSATSNYAVCPITACPGDTVLMTTFSPGSCNGDTYLRLYDPSTGAELTQNDQYGGTDCSQITYTFTASCRTYELREGCWRSFSCGGRVYYTGSSAISQSPIAIATTMPTTNLAAPTVVPGAPTRKPTVVFASPTTKPTLVPGAPTISPMVNGYYCPAFSTSNTNYATSNYAVCPITACPGDTVTMTTFSPGSCNGDNYLRLYDPSTGEQLTYNDDSNGSLCSQITYTFTASCRTYELREGCFSSGSCGGRVYYTGSSAISQSPIAIATTMPTINLAAPTAVPGAPTRKPTVILGAPTGSPTRIIGSPTAFPTGIFGAPTQQNIPESERYALYDLYTSTNGHNWDMYGSSWDFSDPYSNPCTQYWQGLHCSFEYSDGYYHVYYLSLAYRNLVGTIPDSIVNLSYLRGLFLHYNLLFGTIPRSIGQLRSLHDLFLSNNYLTGVIPDSFGQQTSFGRFDVSNNYLEGSLPLSIFNIPEIFYLNVNGNLLNGSLSSNISNIYSLDVSGNNMVGIIPSSLCASDYLQEIYLYGNNFQCYPQCLKSNVRYAYVGNTPLCPPVPSSAPAAPTTLPTHVIDAPTVLPTVLPGVPTRKPTVILGAPTTFPTGTFGAPTQPNLPESERDALYDLYTSTNGHNWYSYGSPWDFSDPHSNPCTQSWQGLRCSSWYSEGNLNVFELYLSDRNLVGTIPDSIVNLSYLSYIYLDYNLLHGTIPRSIGQLPSLYYLFLSNNYLTGVIPDSFGQQNYFVEFDVSNNYLEGSIPLSIFNLPEIWSLNVKGNLLTGSLPDMISNLYMYRLDVSGNNMVGIIPSSYCASYNLQEIYLYGNNFQCYPQCLTSNVRYAYVGNIPLCPPVPSTAPAAPTALPTDVFAAPTTFPSNGYYCPAFSTSNTNSATSNYAVCPITAFPGDTVTMTTLSPGSCNGDTYLRLYDPSTGLELTYNDDFYGVCSQITYTFTASCRTYELREGCFSSGSCGGQVYYFGSSAVSQSPIAIATIIPSSQAPNSVNPSIRPTRKPTARPSSRSPTLKPTPKPSFRPTNHPTNTRNPSSRAPVKPTIVPSRHRATITPTTGSPTVKPTRITSRRQSNPSFRPTNYPTTTPTSTRKPTSRPSVKPTRVPSRRQTTTAPTTNSPTVKPTRIRSRRPSRAPSV